MGDFLTRSNAFIKLIMLTVKLKFRETVISINLMYLWTVSALDKSTAAGYQIT